MRALALGHFQRASRRPEMERCPQNTRLGRLCGCIIFRGEIQKIWEGDFRPFEKMDSVHSLRVATARGAANRSCSAFWFDDGAAAGSSSGGGATAGGGRTGGSSHTPAGCDAASLQNGGAAAVAAAAAAVSASSLMTVRRSTALVTMDPDAVRAATNKLALNAKLGPHTGPGSGSLLAAHISSMNSTLERLDHWRDDSDSENDHKSSSDES